MKKYLSFIYLLLLLPALPAQDQLPLPEQLQEYILYRNSFDTPQKRHDTIKKWKIRADRSTCHPNGLIGKCILFANKSSGFQITTDELSFSKGRTFSIWFRTNKPVPGQSSIRLLDCSLNTGIPKSGWVTMFIMDRMSGLKQPGLFVQAYNLPGCARFHTSVIRDFNTDYTPGKWHHAVIASNGKLVNWYLNGKLIRQRSLESTLPADVKQAVFSFGRTSNAEVFFDELIIFDRMLDEDAIREYYNTVMAAALRSELLR